MGAISLDVFGRVQDVATKSTMVQKHGAVIVQNNQIISEGFNYLANFMSHSYSIHAEVAALMNIPKRYRQKRYLEDSTMVVVRVSGKDNHINMSAPCANCRREIEKAGIKRVFYSSSMNSTNSSS